jgi:hypothetical protein
MSSRLREFNDTLKNYFDQISEDSTTRDSVREAGFVLTKEKVVQIYRAIRAEERATLLRTPGEEENSKLNLLAEWTKRLGMEREMTADILMPVETVTFTERCQKFLINIRRYHTSRSISCHNYFRMGLIIQNLRDHHQRESSINREFMPWGRFLQQFRDASGCTYTDRHLRNFERFSTMVRPYQQILTLGLSPTEIKNKLQLFYSALEEYPEYRPRFATQEQH